MKNTLYTFEQDLNNRLKDKVFKKSWSESEANYQLAKQIIEKRLAAKMSQKILANKVKTSQAAISRIENMNGNPSLDLLKRVAKALKNPIILSLNP